MTEAITIQTEPHGIQIPKGQLRPALRAAIDLIVKEGFSQVDAAKTAGMRQHSLSIALKKPHVRAYVEGVKRAHLGSATFKAWHTVLDLMANAASEDVRHKAARTVLDAAGELGNDGNGDGKAQAQLIQIVTQAVNIGQHPLSERLPGVVEAPAYRVIEHDRQPPDESDGSE